MKTHTLKTLMMAGLASFALSIPASAAPIVLSSFDGDPFSFPPVLGQFIGAIDPGALSSGSVETSQVNQLLSMPTFSEIEIDNVWYLRWWNEYPSLSPAYFLRNVVASQNSEYDISASSYVLAQFDDSVSYLWYVGGSGASEAIFEDGVPVHVSLFTVAPPPTGGGNVPDGGATLMLLGSAVAGMVFLGRKRV